MTRQNNLSGWIVKCSEKLFIVGTFLVGGEDIRYRLEMTSFLVCNDYMHYNLCWGWGDPF